MLTYSEAIEKVMIDNGGFASLKHIYQNIGKYRGKTGKTPNNSIQERVQRDNRFTNIKLGVYALTGYLNKLPQEKPAKNQQEEKERKHAIIQGMLLEIGNHKKYNTYTPDKGWVFEGKTLGSLSTIDKVPSFTYDNIIKDSVNHIDVIWFNERGFPDAIFEVEHSTDFRSSFVKFSELQDFRTKFYSIFDESKKSKFDREIKKSAFKAIQDIVIHKTYGNIESDYDNVLKETHL